MPACGPFGSVDTPQESETLLQPTTDAVSPVGTLGGVVSPLPAKALEHENPNAIKAPIPNRNENSELIRPTVLERFARGMNKRANEGKENFSMSVASWGVGVLLNWHKNMRRVCFRKSVEFSFLHRVYYRPLPGT